MDLSKYQDNIDPNDCEMTSNPGKPPNYMQDISILHRPTGIKVTGRGSNRQRVIKSLSAKLVDIFKHGYVPVQENLHIDYTNSPFVKKG